LGKFFLGRSAGLGGATAVAAFFITNLSVFFPLIAHTGGKKEKKKKKKKSNKPRRSSTAAPGQLVYIESSAQMET
jgi:hypothetical protein